MERLAKAEDAWALVIRMFDQTAFECETGRRCGLPSTIKAVRGVLGAANNLCNIKHSQNYVHSYTSYNIVQIMVFTLSMLKYIPLSELSHVLVTCYIISSTVSIKHAIIQSPCHRERSRRSCLLCYSLILCFHKGSCFIQSISFVPNLRYENYDNEAILRLV